MASHPASPLPDEKPEKPDVGQVTRIALPRHLIVPRGVAAGRNDSMHECANRAALGSGLAGDAALQDRAGGLGDVLGRFLF